MRFTMIIVIKRAVIAICCDKIASMATPVLWDCYSRFPGVGRTAFHPWCAWSKSFVNTNPAFGSWSGYSVGAGTGIPSKWWLRVIPSGGRNWEAPAMSSVSTISFLMRCMALGTPDPEEAEWGWDIPVRLDASLLTHSRTSEWRVCLRNPTKLKRLDFQRLEWWFRVLTALAEGQFLAPTW